MANNEKIVIGSPNRFDRGRAEKFDMTRAAGSLRSSTDFQRMLTVDEEARTAEFSFASDKPIEHWFGYLILDTKPEAVVLDRITSGVCPHLINHDTDKQVGVVVKDSVTVTDGSIRGKVKFSRSKLGRDIFADVIDEIRVGVSFGFLVHEMILESEEDGIPTYRATKYEILETSSASIAADISVGFGRSFESENLENSTKEETMAKEENKEETPQSAEETRAESGALETAREIREFGELLGEETLAREFIADTSKTVADFRAEVLARQKASTPVPPQPADDLARQQGGGDEVKLARSVYRGGKLKSFHGERAQETAHRMGMWLGATLFRNEKAAEFCREKGIPLTRVQSGSVNEQGGFLVPDEFENVMIDLRIEYGVFRANANIVPMVSDTKSRPRRTGGLTAHAVGPGQRGDFSDKTWDLVELIARKWMALAKYEEEFSEDAVINIADDLASEMAYAFTQVEDDAGFNGDGTSQHHGIVGLTNRLRNPGNLSTAPAVGNVAGLVVASGNAWNEITEADMLAVIGRLPQFARRSGMVKWYCSHEFWANVLQRIMLAKGGVSYAEIGGELKEVFMGKPVEIVEVMPSTEANSQIPVIYGNLSQSSMFGDRRGVSIKTTDSNSTDFEADLITIKGTERFDINNHDVGNADATAAKRKAGPVVGLITAAS